MKRVLTIMGILMMLISLFSVLQYVFSSGTLSDYEKGAITGKVILFLVGAILFYFGRRKKSSQ